jgi:transcriptional regulator with XRE-family HTH domain
MSVYFSEKFKQLRKARDLTQEDAAGIFHVSPQTVSRWETGANYPDVDMLPHIAIYFNVTIDDLLGTETLRGEEDVKQLIKDIRNLLNSGKHNDAVTLSRKAVKKYPLNPQLHYHLVQGLTVQDSTPEFEGKHKDEIIAINKRLIDLLDYKSSLLHRTQLIQFYVKYRMTEEAKQLLNTLPEEIWYAKEPYTGLVLEGEEWVHNQKNRIIRAMYLLDYLIEGYARQGKGSIPTQKKIQCMEAQLTIAGIIKSLVDDGDVGTHLEQALSHITIAELYAELTDKENTLKHIETATQHSMYHTDHMDKTNEDDGGNYMPWATPRNLPWLLWEDHLMKTVFDFVREDGRFVGCFGQLKVAGKEL